MEESASTGASVRDEAADVINDILDRRTGAADGTDEGVINVNVYDHESGERRGNDIRCWHPSGMQDFFTNLRWYRSLCSLNHRLIAIIPSG